MNVLDAAISHLSLLVQLFAASPICQIALFGLVTWRLWRFTISPALYPEDPREVPYWIPCMPSFQIAKQNRTKEPFAITFAGQTMYIISDPKDAAEISRNSTNVSRDLPTKEMYTRLGITQTVVDQLFTIQPDTSAGSGNSETNNNTSSLHPTDTIMEMYRVHLSPGPRLDTFLEADIIPRIQAAFKLDSLQQMSARGIIGAYYGDLLFCLHPGLMQQYMIWEKVNWKFIFGLPSFLSGDMLDAQRGLVDAFTRYFAIPAEKRGHSNFWVDSVESLLRHLDISNEDIGRLFMLQTWGILGNVFKTTFWVVAYILDDPALVEAITTEIHPAVTRGPQGVTIHHHYLSEKCPKLDSLFSEVLRLTMTSPMARDIVSPATIGSRRLREGRRVLILYRQLHLDPTTWGPTPERFQPDRFLRDITLKSNIAYRPWVAGKNLCPGRFLAKRAVFTFVACLFGQFDVSLVDERGGQIGDTSGNGGKKTFSRLGKAFPEADLSKPTPGIASIADGQDVLLRLRRRDRARAPVPRRD
ncbi:putative cytochrome P450 [Aspergillus sclerotioniger CBS 115572]|uniref:Putative cytochrome P450 n=1 Tax=Aspergillus sclerotioniger CBS 115572 TaxID=1450535 RepID=A0A317XA67_9EURO|nr:putative cytochrome P450 [Aspergillus sclerotioniger CBS 115572]PWY94542.1 putative cytochrome P450 [Aspergillus sclerotioniger CBS 115572]